ncbi:MAG: hypothetical protein JNG88_03400 [Phycisphaerales bacterium]|nr:hypothetical protein [Phycisphaerales bacterium]
MNREITSSEAVLRGDVATGGAGAFEDESVLGRAEPVDEFLLIPFGDVAVERALAGRSFEFTPEHADSAAKWFARLGRKLVIDYEHQSLDRLNSRVDGLRPAAGWIGRLEIRDDGLWAIDVEWTDRARELIAAGEYRYFSPVIYWADEDYRELASLGPVGLTNDPAIRGVAPLAAAKVDSTTTVCEAKALAIGEAVGVVGLRSALRVARLEARKLRGQLRAQEAEAFVERGMRLGKITDATSMDWRADYSRDPHDAEARLARAPISFPPGRLVVRGAAAQGGAARDAQLDEAAADLAAFERASAAGRVRIA